MKFRLIKRHCFRLAFVACAMYVIYKEFIKQNDSWSMRFVGLNTSSLLSPRAIVAYVIPEKLAPEQLQNWKTLPTGPNVQVNVVNCSRIFANDETELLKAETYQNDNPKQLISPAEFVQASANCSDFIIRRAYITNAMTEEERSFPIAFSILTYRDVEQIERLLRAIYRPQNFYCIHVDKKSKPATHEAIKAIATCFDNVFIASKSVAIQWGDYTILEADLVCMEELLRYKTWRYFINLTGMEFPLKTNGDLVKILRAYNGANDVMGITLKHQNRPIKERTQKKMLQVPIPQNISIVKGAMQVTLSRAFVEFVFNDKTATDFRKWIADTAHPDESYIQTLNYNEILKAPGAYLGDPNKLDPPFLSRYVVWDYSGHKPNCHGWRRRAVCVFGVRDLPSFVSRKELFLNKLMLDYQPLTYDCIEEWHFRKIRDEYAGRRHFNSTYYAQTEFAKYHRNSVAIR